MPARFELKSTMSLTADGKPLTLTLLAATKDHCLFLSEVKMLKYSAGFVESAALQSKQQPEPHHELVLCSISSSASVKASCRIDPNECLISAVIVNDNPNFQALALTMDTTDDVHELLVNRKVKLHVLLKGRDQFESVWLSNREVINVPESYVSNSANKRAADWHFLTPEGQLAKFSFVARKPLIGSHIVKEARLDVFSISPAAQTADDGAWARPRPRADGAAAAAHAPPKLCLAEVKKVFFSADLLHKDFYRFLEKINCQHTISPFILVQSADQKWAIFCIGRYYFFLQEQTTFSTEWSIQSSGCVGLPAASHFLVSAYFMPNIHAGLARQNGCFVMQDPDTNQRFPVYVSMEVKQPLTRARFEFSSHSAATMHLSESSYYNDRNLFVVTCQEQQVSVAKYTYGQVERGYLSDENELTISLSREEKISGACFLLPSRPDNECQLLIFSKTQVYVYDYKEDSAAATARPVAAALQASPQAKPPIAQKLTAGHEAPVARQPPQGARVMFHVVEGRDGQQYSVPIQRPQQRNASLNQSASASSLRTMGSSGTTGDSRTVSPLPASSPSLPIGFSLASNVIFIEAYCACGNEAKRLLTYQTPPHTKVFWCGTCVITLSHAEA